MAKQLDYSAMQRIFRRFQDLEPEPKGELHHTNAFTLVVAVALSAQVARLRAEAYATPLVFPKEVMADAQVVQQSAEALFGRGLDTIVDVQLARRATATTVRGATPAASSSAASRLAAASSPA